MGRSPSPKVLIVTTHILLFQIYYKFNPIMLLQEPLLVVIAFMVIFASVIVIVRLDFSISVVSVYILCHIHFHN